MRLERCCSSAPDSCSVKMHNVDGNSSMHGECPFCIWLCKCTFINSQINQCSHLNNCNQSDKNDVLFLLIVDKHCGCIWMENILVWSNHYSFSFLSIYLINNDFFIHLIIIIFIFVWICFWGQEDPLWQRNICYSAFGVIMEVIVIVKLVVPWKLFSRRRIIRQACEISFMKIIICTSRNANR